MTGGKSKPKKMKGHSRDIGCVSGKATTSPWATFSVQTGLLLQVFLSYPHGLGFDFGFGFGFITKIGKTKRLGICISI